MADRIYRNDRPIPRDSRDCYDCQGTNGGHYRECRQYFGADRDLARKDPDPRQPCETTKDRIGDYKTRKQRPLCTGVLDYFPDALLEVAHCSWVGNEQHNPGQKLHWAKEKSIGEGNEILRHLIDRGTRDSDGVRHLAKAAWRCLELLQREIDAEKATPWLTKDTTRAENEVRENTMKSVGPRTDYTP